jgi:hypothetical protein
MISAHEDQVKVSKMVQVHSMNREITCTEFIHIKRLGTFLFFISRDEFEGTPTDVPLDASITRVAHGGYIHMKQVTYMRVQLSNWAHIMQTSTWTRPDLPFGLTATSKQGN